MQIQIVDFGVASKETKGGSTPPQEDNPGSQPGTHAFP